MKFDGTPLFPEPKVLLTVKLPEGLARRIPGAAASEHETLNHAAGSGTATLEYEYSSQEMRIDHESERSP